MAKYIKCEVSREQYSEVYIEVPDDFDVWDIYDEFHEEVQRITEETVGDLEWECDDEVSWSDVREVSEEEANQYKCGVLKSKEQ